MKDQQPKIGDLIEIIQASCFAYDGDFGENGHPHSLRPTTLIPHGTIALITGDVTGHRGRRWLNILANGSQFSIRAWTGSKDNNTRYRIVT